MEAFAGPASVEETNSREHAHAHALRAFRLGGRRKSRSGRRCPTEASPDCDAVPADRRGARRPDRPGGRSAGGGGACETRLTREWEGLDAGLPGQVITLIAAEGRPMSSCATV